MNSIHVETFSDDLGHLLELAHRGLGDDDMYRCQRFLLVQLPNVEVMSRENARNLYWAC